MKKFSARFYTMFFRVFGTFAILILLFALLLGFVFIRLYSQSSREYSEEQLMHVAQSSAEHFRQFVRDNDDEAFFEYLNTFVELEAAELWTISNEKASEPMADRFASIDLEGTELQEEFISLIKKAFIGKTTTDMFYSDMHGATTMVVSIPIMGNGREVCGALLMVMGMEQMDETISSCIRMIGISALIALVFCGVIAMWLARRITKPITHMGRVAGELMKGNYLVKTNIDRTDEIGDMARSMDLLADKLRDNDEERKNMEQMRLDFFANVSHELRTPIAVVRAYTESLVDGVVTDEDQVLDYYSRILRECTGMQRLVADLLTLSKMQNPNFKIEKESVNLVHIFDELIRSALAISTEKNISIQVRYDKDVCMMMGDYDRLRQMFLVIFDNAIKFSPENSSIYVSITSSDMLRVSIRDEGIGIAEDELPNIFDKFYKSKLRQNSKGTGLGLPIAKYIALKHDGSVEVKSEVGKGTEFIFSFHEISEEEYLLSEK